MAKRGRGKGKIFFCRDVIAVIVKARGRERGNACSFIGTLPYGDRNEWFFRKRGFIDASRKTNHVDHKGILYRRK